ncbi:MAG: hypothetical protein KC493_16345 [Bacteriovoracaceae bacterium]|nr:hypothetical protein [Bacteriovoracaceae bacterium]
MKPRVDEEAQRLLTLLKLDARRLYERIRYRAPEYLFIFSSKRTRNHFADIFENRYKDVTIESLKMVGQEVIVALDNYYSLVEEMYWYVNSTEDMPNTVDDKINKFIVKLTPIYQTLCLYIDADLGITSEEVEPVDDPVFEDSIVTDDEPASEPVEFGESAFGEETTFSSEDDSDIAEFPSIEFGDDDDDDDSKVENVS